MTRIERKHQVVEMEAIRPGTKRETTAPSAGLAIAGLRESVDGLELRLDDVDERVAALELDAGAESTTHWEALARGSVPYPKETDAEATAVVPVPPEPEGAKVDDEQPTSSKFAAVNLPQAPRATEHEKPQASAGVLVVLSDRQFERLFGTGSARTDAIERDPAAAHPPGDAYETQQGE
jgi:hypothetical protein